MAELSPTRNRQFVTKQMPAFVMNLDEAAGIVEAIVNVFGILDDGDDIIQAGAFTKTIAERGLRVQVLDQHRTDSVLRVLGKVLIVREVGRDELPAQVLERYPDATGGLWTRTRYLLETPEGRGAFQRIALGAVSEYSIGIDAVKTKYQKAVRADGTEANARVITEVRLWEYSPVIWGMNPATATVNVKSGDGAPDNSKRRLMGLGTYLQTSVVTDPGYMLRHWLSTAVITLDEYQALNTLLVAAAQMVVDGMEVAVRDRIYVPDYLSAGAPDELKAGRVLSDRNYRRIMAAWDALREVMTDAGMMDTSDAESEKNSASDEKTAREDGAETGTAPLTQLEIERDLVEMELSALKRMGATT
ncbi:MAG: HK97 family phage prohead protease [Chloroflexota bacterium]|nr:HK97 family phage prohead protease [Chloroflexota bacterium]